MRDQANQLLVFLFGPLAFNFLHRWWFWFLFADGCSFRRYRGYVVRRFVLSESLFSPGFLHLWIERFTTAFFLRWRLFVFLQQTCSALEEVFFEIVVNFRVRAVFVRRVAGWRRRCDCPRRLRFSLATSSVRLLRRRRGFAFLFQPAFLAQRYRLDTFDNCPRKLIAAKNER